MATPTLRYVAPTGNEPTHLEPEPVIIHDLPTGGGAVAWSDVTGKPATFPPAAHSATLVNVAAYADGGITAGNAQVVIQALADRIAALEAAAG